MKPVLWFLLSWKRYWKRPGFLLLLLVLPCSAFFFQKEEDKPQQGIRIAVYAESKDPDSLDQMLVEKLTAYRNEAEGMFSFYQVSSMEELEKEVAARKAECGYVIYQGLEEKLEKRKWKGAIGLYEAPSTVAGLLSTETVFSLMIEEYDKTLFLNYMADKLPRAKEEGLGDGYENGYGNEYKSEYENDDLDAEELYDSFLKNGTTFQFLYEDGIEGKGRSGKDMPGREDGSGQTDRLSQGEDLNQTGNFLHSLQEESKEAVPRQEKGTIFPVRGFVAVFLFITGLYGGVTLGQDEKQGLFFMLPAMEKGLCRFASLAAPVMLGAVSGIATLWISGEMGFWLRELGLLLAYAIAVTIFSMAVKRITVRGELLSCMIPFFLLGSLIFCPVFVDVGQYVKGARLIGRLFLPYYYLAFF